MKNLIYFLTLFILQPALAQSDRVAFTGNVQFTSEAPLEIIIASSTHLNGIIDFKENKFAFSIRMRTFDGFNSALQKEHFNENYLESEKYPTATYSGKILDEIDLSKNYKTTVRTKGIFTIHGISKEQILKNQITVNNKLKTIESSFVLSLEEYNISIPRIVNKKIANEVRITIQSKSGK